VTGEHMIRGVLWGEGRWVGGRQVQGRLAVFCPGLACRGNKVAGGSPAHHTCTMLPHLCCNTAMPQKKCKKMRRCHFGNLKTLTSTPGPDQSCN
jgi:hypothetical protein